MDNRLHNVTNCTDRNVVTIIAGHTHFAIFENLSLTEKGYLESKDETDGVKIIHQPDRSCYNAGPCVHPLSITNGPHLRLIEWGRHDAEGSRTTIRREVLYG